MHGRARFWLARARAHRPAYSINDVPLGVAAAGLVQRVACISRTGPLVAAPGTAITVSLLAILSVYARKGALRLAALIPDRAARLAVALDLVAVLGGLVILIAGIFMLQAALTVPAHPLR